MNEFIKVKFLENFGSYEKGEIREINKLNLKDFKDKVEVLEKEKEVKKASNKAILKPKNTK